MKASGEKAHWLIFDCVTNCIAKDDVDTINDLGRFRELKPDSPELHAAFDIDFADMEPGLPRINTFFRQPFVFEIAGSGFDKTPNREMFTLRFPRVTKVHWDKDWKDSVSFEELQEMAAIARTVPIGDLKDEVADWMVRLDQVDKCSTAKLAPWNCTDDEEEPQRPEEKITPAKAPAVSKACSQVTKVSSSAFGSHRYPGDDVPRNTTLRRRKYRSA